jgi:hypothetical protein
MQRRLANWLLVRRNELLWLATNYDRRADISTVADAHPRGSDTGSAG